MTLALPGHGNTAHSAAQPLRLWFGLPVAIGQASNVLKWGTGALNIDASRVSTGGEIVWKVPPSDKKSVSLSIYDKSGSGSNSMFKNKGDREGTPLGRFPANLVLSEGEAVDMLDEQASQNVSRFFYIAKISKSERNAGTENNHHPTVKSKKLMAYLAKMITPPGGIILDPFMGSGSTGIAAVESGFDFIGIEKDLEYFNIASKRIKHAEKNK